MLPRQSATLQSSDVSKTAGESILHQKAVIKEWKYSREIEQSSDQDKSYIRTLTLDGEFWDVCPLFGSKPLNCLIRCGTDKYAEQPNLIGCLEFIEEMKEYGLPAFYSLDITLPEAEFDDLRECLVQSMAHPQALVSLDMSVQGCQQKRIKSRSGEKWYEEEVIEHVSGRPLDMTDFGWNLQCSNYSTQGAS